MSSQVSSSSLDHGLESRGPEQRIEREKIRWMKEIEHDIDANHPEGFLVKIETTPDAPKDLVQPCLRTATAGSDVVQSGRPIFDDFFQHLWPYIGNNTANVVFQMVKRLWLIHIDQ
ncbi:hypothetical protein TNCV_4832271 [Trichonephila clavipes]|nr:hypothetical protein TNCV_4832271 [Trichonephila clavipes]